MKMYIYTDKGWINEEKVLTPITWNIRKNTKHIPVKPSDQLTEKFKQEMPFVVLRRGYYLIQSVN